MSMQAAVFVVNCRVKSKATLLVDVVFLCLNGRLVAGVTC